MLEVKQSYMPTPIAERDLHPRTGHFVFGEGASFIDAQHIDTPQSLNRGQLPDDSLLLAHPDDPQGQGHGYHDGQSLGDRSYCQTGMEVGDR